jgi:hypothetical protein
MTPSVLAEIMSKTVREAFDRTEHPDLCIHLPARAEEAIKTYVHQNPSEVLMAVMKARGGDRTMINDIVANSMGKESDVVVDCDDTICLVCRRSRMMDRTLGAEKVTGAPELLAMAEFLGDDVMQSIKWVTNILKGTIESGRSSDAHKQKAALARNTMIPSLIASAAMVHDLHRDLKEAIEARDKYHKLADMLMDAESDPAS